MSIVNKQIAVFDLDGTITESKTQMDSEMADLMIRLLAKRKVAIISGGAFIQFERQMPALKGSEDLLKNLFLFPTTGTRFFRFDGDWKEVYADEMTIEERQKIKNAFEQAYKDIDYHHPTELFGEVVEDRGTQVTFSALGQQAPLELKKQWRETQDRRPELVMALEKYLSDFEVKMPGVTSIDVTRKGIDKAYGIKKIEELLGIPVSEMIFVGDALYEGGNDYAVKRTGVETVEVANPSETKVLLRKWLDEIEK